MIWINEERCDCKYRGFSPLNVSGFEPAGGSFGRKDLSEMKRLGCLITATSGMTLMANAAWTQDIGQPAQGRVLSQQICSECHSIEKAVARSPNAAAPRFEVIANTPGMTAIALTAALQTSHRTMPNVILQPDEFGNVVAYILSLRQGN